jgi:hypothetical protein
MPTGVPMLFTTAAVGRKLPVLGAVKTGSAETELESCVLAHQAVSVAYWVELALPM